MRGIRSLVFLVCLGASANCASGRAGWGTVIPIPAAAGPATLRVVYPPPGAAIGARDSAFLFGSVGRGDASLHVNGLPIPVLPNGSWIAWLPLPDDTAATFAFELRAGDRVVADTLRFPIRGFRAPPGGGAWIDTTSLMPSGHLELPAEEEFALAVRASPGAEVRLRLPGGEVVPLQADTLPAEPGWGVRAFAVDPAAQRRPPRPDHYRGWVRAAQLAAATAAGGATVEVTTGADTVSWPWPLTVSVLPGDRPVVVVLDDDRDGTGLSDSLTVGRALPGGTYHWFFPTGTSARVTGRWNDLVRLRLSQRSSAWVPAEDAHPLPAGTAPPQGAAVGAVRAVPLSDRTLIRIPVTLRVPFRIDEEDRSLTVRLYGAQADIDWVQYGETDGAVRRLAWDQPADDEVTVTAQLAHPVWGYRARWRGRDLVVELRRAPEIDRRRPLRGRTILLDPGHPPLGATGPSGQREADVTLAVARAAQALLEARGARVRLTRGADTAVSLTARVNLAERGDAEVLVSIHTNALPDGVNPLVNHGTSTYYFHPRSLPLARAVNRAITAAFGTRDLGIGRADLALARPAWLPAILVEGLFQMLPEHDAWLATEEGRRRYAAAIVEGLATFFRAHASP